jgi:very-short-patch-repair endonuclease
MESPKRTRTLAKQLWARLDLPEVILWNALRRRRLGGLHFRRQHPLGPYIIDFYCAEPHPAVEVDGYSHDVADRPERDAMRDAWLLERGVATLRIAVRDVLNHLDDVLNTILAAARR